jgi:hypothetical protein
MIGGVAARILSFEVGSEKQSFSANRTAKPWTLPVFCAIEVDDSVYFVDYDPHLAMWATNIPSAFADLLN